MGAFVVIAGSSRWACSSWAGERPHVRGSAARCWSPFGADHRLQPGGARASSPTWSPFIPSTRSARAYQLTHSLIAFGRGEIFGQGLGGSVEKLNLPEAHTDFLLAVIGEELGFVGVAW